VNYLVYRVMTKKVENLVEEIRRIVESVYYCENSYSHEDGSVVEYTFYKTDKILEAIAIYAGTDKMVASEEAKEPKEKLTREDFRLFTAALEAAEAVLRYNGYVKLLSVEEVRERLERLVPYGINLSKYDLNRIAQPLHDHLKGEIK